MSNTSEGGGVVLPFPGQIPEANYAYMDNEYVDHQADQVVDAVVRLGLDTEFVRYFSQHLHDLRLVCQADIHLRVSAAEKSRLLVNNNPTVLPEQEQDTASDDAVNRPRLLVVSETDVLERSSILRKAFDCSDVRYGNKVYADPNIHRVSVDWIFAEQSMYALGNAVFMQKTFGRYLPDFHGQNQNYRAERMASTDFLKKNPDSEVPIGADFQYLKEGFGFLMLHESLLGRAVLKRSVEADWILTGLRKEYQTAYRHEVVAAHLGALEPRTDLDRAYQEDF